MESVGSRLRLAALVACLLAAVAAAGCGGGNDEASGDAGATQAQGDQEPATVSMAYMATASDAAMVLGEKQGFFDDAGIDLQLEQVATTGAVAIPALLEGQYDAAGGGIDAPIVAAAKGLPIQVLGHEGAPVSKGTTYPASSETGTSAIVVPGNSDIKTLADLKGSNLAAITVHGLQYLCIAGALDKQGLRPDALDILEIPPPEMLPALESNQVAAATLVEPFLTQALQQGYRIISYPCEEAIAGAIQAGFYVSSEWAEQNPDVAARLAEALVRSNRYAEEHPDELRAVIPEYTKISPKLAEEITLSRYDTESGNTLDVVANALVEQGTVEEAPDLDAILTSSESGG